MPDETLLSGRYRLGAQLGGGGMADVYEAVDERLGRTVAVKLFRGAGDERHAAEVQVLAALNHPNLVQIYDAELGRPAYVVMELVRGRSLDVLLRTGAVLDVPRIGSGVADGLAYAHARGVVHRDVKPGNVIVPDEGHVKLADFGIARLVDQAHLTATGQLMGTAAYLAPEQARGEALTGAADVYSLGLVLLECQTGRREYDGPPTEAAIARLSRPPAIPSGLPHAALLTAMTAMRPEDRPTAAEVSARLRGAEPATVVLPRAAAPAPTTVLAPVPLDEPEPLRRRASPWPWIIGVLLLLAAAVVVFVLAFKSAGGNGSPATTPTDTFSSPTSSSSSASATTQSSATSTTTSTPPTTTSRPPTTTSSPPRTTSAPPSTSASAPASLSVSLPGSTQAAAARTTGPAAAPSTSATP